MLTSPSARSGPALDLRRAIARHVWLGNRARNALQRPAFIGAISISTFVTAIVSMVVVPRMQQQAGAVVPTIPRPDTLSVAAAAALARVRLVRAESTLAVSRATVIAEADRRAADSLRRAAAMPDTTSERVDALRRALARAKQSPLPSSYRALASLPELRSDPKIRALVDSLTELEREREGFGAVGGVDPVFVALTSRANEVGRAIQSVAEAHLATLAGQREVAAPADSVLAGAAIPDTSAAPAPDSTAAVAARDSLRAIGRQLDDSLSNLRAIVHAMDLDEERQRERAMAVAPPLALLASAFVLSAAIGFFGALIGELRRPRVSDATELERFLGVRVLSTLMTQMPSLDRGRREADRMAPPYFDPGAEGYQLAYLGLATEHPTLLTATVTAADPAIAAVVACNLAAVAADEARNTVVVDLEPSCSASAALRARAEPGVLDILARGLRWTDTTVTARVGRDKTVDLLPYGMGAPAALDAVASWLREDAPRLARYYDAIFAVASEDHAAEGISAALPSADIVYCARPGITPLRHISDRLDAIRARGGVIRGVVLWDADRPLLPTPRETSSRTRRGRHDTRAAALAT